ncbi:MAG TPA: hypothetical protein VLI89_06795 [Burkholderiales bacterium]|nr:hypothetical protein [Burkholderiales bacterium]
MGHAVVTQLSPIADTSIFDLRLSRRGRRLNKMCAALCSPQARRVHRHYYAPMTTGMGLITFEG